MMNTSRGIVISWFLAAGVVSGLLSAVLLQGRYMYYLGAFGLGLLFVAALSAAIAASHRSLGVSIERRRASVAALVVALGYPIVFLGIALPAAETLHSDLLATVLAGGAGAYLVGLALRVLSRRWDRPILLGMIVIGVTTPILGIAPRPWNLAVTPVWQVCVAVLSGLWLVRPLSDRRVEAVVSDGRVAPADVLSAKE